MKRRTVFALAGAALLATAAGYAAWQAFAPEGSTRVDQPFPDLGGTAQATTSPAGPRAAASPAPLRSGTFQGADGFHYASGTVALHRAANGTYVLRFEGYDAREGPDIYLFLTRQAGERDAAAVEQGHRLHIPGGQADGRATLRGSFNVFLPAGVDPLQYGGVTIWCDQFDHFFGYAPLA